MRKVVLPDKVRYIFKLFAKHDAELFVVGGAVRDLLLGRSVKDWDFATNLHPEQVLQIFPKTAFYTNTFGTVSVVLKDGEIFEITTYRTEREYTDSRHPDKVEWGKTLEEDLARRDFTINAMALGQKSENDEVQLIDPYHGQNDLEMRLIRAVGKAQERFGEDALRMMRAVRIAAQVGFFIEDETYAQIQKNAELIKHVAYERIRDEFFKVLCARYKKEGVLLLLSSGLMTYFLPEMVETVGVAQAKHHIYDVWNHSLNALAASKAKSPVTLLAIFIHDIGKPVVAQGVGEKRTFHNHEMAGAAMAKRLALRFRLAKKQADKLYRLVRWHQFTMEEGQTDKAIRRFIRNVGTDYLDDMIELRRADRVGSGAKEDSWRFDLFRKRVIEVQNQPFALKDLKTNGHELMHLLGIDPGPVIGKLLSQLFAEVEDDPAKNTPEYLHSRAQELMAKMEK